jgi:two-component system cell cycle response regulator
MVCKVLIIDDARALHALVKEHLGTHNFEVLSAYDGVSGLATAMDHRPDIILLDVDMPALSGFEVCQWLKANSATRPIPILFLSAASTLDHKIQGLDLGAVDYLTKPFEPAELRARVRAALRTKVSADVLAQNSFVDETTGLFDRKYFDTRVEADLALARRTGRALGCILADIDKMGAVNTAFGRKVGDDLLRVIGHSLHKMCRIEDVVARFDSDEFGFLVSDADPEILQEVAERVRIAVSTTSLDHLGQIIQVTASIGYALTHFSTGVSIVVETQSALFRARAAGRNCVRAGRELSELCLAV